jgi:hypothetical protein
MGFRVLWSRKQADGAEVCCVLRYDGGVGAVLTLTVASAQAEDVTAIAISDALRELLDREGATPLVAGPEAA